MATDKEYKAVIDALSGECERLHKENEELKKALENHDTFMKYAYSQGKQDALSQEPTITTNNNDPITIIYPTIFCDDTVSRDFEIGDEVRIIGSDPIYDDCDVGWVIRNASEKVKTMYVMRNDGSAEEEAKAEWYKTGRHNSMLAEVIKALPSVTQKSNTKYR